ncbi:MAG: DUF1573 domain-containing protein [Planctomycetota bacterium]|jgi:hypothetical protein
MRRTLFTIVIVSVNILNPLGIVSEEGSTILSKDKTIAESPTKVIMLKKPTLQSIDTVTIAKSIEPRISFEKTVIDLSHVGRGTKNTCEFRFTNTGRGLLKIGNISRTCGCTAFQLDKKEYAPNETGTIKVIYTAGKSTATTQKSIYVPTNDKANPRVKLTVKARIVQLVEVTPQKLQLSLRKDNGCIPDIQLTSRDGRPFSIKNFKSTNHNSIVADFDPVVSASMFILRPESLSPV